MISDGCADTCRTSLYSLCLGFLKLRKMYENVACWELEHSTRWKKNLKDHGNLQKTCVVFFCFFSKSKSIMHIYPTHPNPTFSSGVTWYLGYWMMCNANLGFTMKTSGFRHHALAQALQELFLWCGFDPARAGLMSIWFWWKFKKSWRKTYIEFHTCLEIYNIQAHAS